MNGVTITSFPRGRTALAVLVGGLLVAQAGASLAAAASCDFPRAVACRDVTPEGWDRPGERIVEAEIRLSVRFQGQEAKYVEEVVVDLDGASENLRVHGFAPTTELASELAKDIERTETIEKSHSLNGTVGGELPVVAGDVVAHVTPSISGGLGGRETTTERSSRRPPRHVVVVSGTTNEGRGVFFKLKRTSQNTLEGVHELRVTYLVPADWQTGSLRVACRAHGRQRFLGLVEQPKVYGEAAAPVHLYLAGNETARQVAERRAGNRQHHECCRMGTPNLRTLLADPIAVIDGDD